MCGDEPVGDPGLVIEDLLLRIGNRHLAPVDFQGIGSLGQRNVVGPAVGVGEELTVNLHPDLQRPQVGAGAERVDPLVKSRMGLGLADQQAPRGDGAGRQ